jgi:hypothetical protein
MEQVLLHGDPVNNVDEWHTLLLLVDGDFLLENLFELRGQIHDPVDEPEQLPHVFRIHSALAEIERVKSSARVCGARTIVGAGGGMGPEKVKRLVDVLG